MLSFLNMECPACGSEYTLSIEELNVMVLFTCFECGQNNVYVAGHVIELDQDTIDNGAEKEKRRHIIEKVQSFAMEFAGNVIGNVDRIINVNMEAKLPEKDRRKKKNRKKKANRKRQISGPQLLPSIELVNSSEISSQEMSDFRRIDLQLIDKKEFFDRFFGGENS